MPANDLRGQAAALSACTRSLEFLSVAAQVRTVSWRGYGRCRVGRRIASGRNLTAPVPERILDASHQDFDLFALDGSLNWSGLLFFKHHAVSIAHVVFELFKSCALAEHTGDLWKAANEPLAIFPVLKLKPK